jgi:DNA mismatch repair ATPase MutL
MGKKHRVVTSAEEAQRAAVSEQLLNQGKQNFEQVYGSKDAGSFNLTEDMNAMGSVKMMSEKEIQQNQTAGQIQGQESPVTFVPQVEPQPMYTMPSSAPPPQEQQEPENKNTEEQEEEKKEDLSEDPDKRAEQVAEFIGKLHANAPTAQMLKSWRQMHGDIFMLDIADKIYIYRYIKRQEWIQMNANPRKGELTELQVEEDIFNRCLLWPKLDMIQTAGMPAGGISMVVQQIRLQSLFLDPGYVAQMTVKI